MIRGALNRYRFMREHRWTHPRIPAYVDDELDRSATARAEAHLEACPQCRRVLGTLRRALSALRGLRAEPPLDLAEGVIDGLRRSG